MDLSSWDVTTDMEDLWIRLFFDGDEEHDYAEESGWIRVPDWMGNRFANAILESIEYRRRTRRDGNRRMLVGVYTGQVFCEPCYLEVDGNTPAITQPYDGDRECCNCKFMRERDDSETEPCDVGVDQGANPG